MPGFATFPAGTADAIIATMLDRGILWEDTGMLAMGEAGEREYGWRHYMEVMSAFLTPPLFQVRHGRQDIGVVDNTSLMPRARGEPIVLSLGGRSWRLRSVDWRRSVVYVEPSTDAGRSRWRGGGMGLEFEMCRRIRALLVSDTERDCWSQRARAKLAEARLESPWLASDATTVLLGTDGELTWWTFAGRRANASLAAALDQRLEGRITSDNFAVKIEAHAPQADVEQAISELRTADPASLLPSIDADALTALKFVNCLPPALAEQMLQQRVLDEPGLRGALREPCRFVSS